MTTDQFNKKLEAKIALIQKENKPLLIAVKNIMAIQSKRIFLDAENKNGSEIGKYKGGEVYISVANSPKKFTPKGKPETGRKIKNRKTGYFPSYLDYKKKIGRNQKKDSVDLILSRDLLMDWSNAEVISKAAATKISPHHYQVAIKPENSDKVKRYGVNTVFGLSKSEKEAFIKTLNVQLMNALK